MKRLKCVIVEDQLPAQRILQAYIEKVPRPGIVWLPLLILWKQVLFWKIIRLIYFFMDIHLPKISGIDFLKTLHKKPNIILTTAFTEYALEGYELDVVDYLLKPISFERFLKSISKINRLIGNAPPIIHQRYLFVRTKGLIQKIKIEDIQFIEAKGDFVLINTTAGRYTANSSLQDILTRLGPNFIRSHKSYVVNLNAINTIVGNTIKIGQHTLAIGRTYRNELLEKLKNHLNLKLSTF